MPGASARELDCREPPSPPNTFRSKILRFSVLSVLFCRLLFYHQIPVVSSAAIQQTHTPPLLLQHHSLPLIPPPNLRPPISLLTPPWQPPDQTHTHTHTYPLQRVFRMRNAKFPDAPRPGRPLLPSSSFPTTSSCPIRGLALRTPDPCLEIAPSRRCSEPTARSLVCHASPHA